MKVKLLNFKEYLGRSDVKNHLWFCMDNAFLTRTEHFGKLTVEAVVAHVYIASESTKLKRAELELNEKHVEAFSMMPFWQFEVACEKLSEIGLIAISRSDGAQAAHVTRTSDVQEPPRDTSAEGKEGKEGKGNAHAEVPSATTYEFFDQPKKKRERKPKPKLPCDPIPAFKEIEEILREREVTTILQQKWEKTYQLAAVVAAVRKADSWLVSSGEQKKNYGQYFNNWLMRDAEKNPRILRAPAQPAQSELPASAPSGRKKTWWEQQQDEADRKAAQGGAQ